MVDGAASRMSKILAAAIALWAAAAAPAHASEWHGAGPDTAREVVAGVERPCRDAGLSTMGVYRYTCNSARLRAQGIEN